MELHLTHGSITRTLQEEDVPLKVGRADDADLRVASRRVSRAHATISVRDGRAVLTDRSTAGTWVATGGTTVTVRRESIHLVGEGEIGLGSPPSEDHSTTLRYRLRQRQ